MNKELILEWADRIEKMPWTSVWDPEGFNMACTVHECGTPCCIAGHVAMSILPFAHLGKMIPIAMEAFDLDQWTAFALFTPPDIKWEHISPSHAARTMRHLAHTGKVDWSIDGSVNLA